MDELKWCIEYLEKYNGAKAPRNLDDYGKLRALMNITMPKNLSEEYYEKEQIVLKNLSKNRNTIYIKDLSEIEPKISLFKGDILELEVDAIVNAGNKELLGCFIPLHSCIDNAIHSAAGLKVREDMMKIMNEQGREEENGQVKVSDAYALKCKYIFHTVGPEIYGYPTTQDQDDLRNCYLSCLKKADEMGLKSIAFCSISTGVFGYPIEEASKIAVETTREYLKNSKIERVIFDLFSDHDYEVYLRLFK